MGCGVERITGQGLWCVFVMRRPDLRKCIYSASRMWIMMRFCQKMEVLSREKHRLCVRRRLLVQAGKKSSFCEAAELPRLRIDNAQAVRASVALRCLPARVQRSNERPGVGATSFA